MEYGADCDYFGNCEFSAPVGEHSFPFEIAAVFINEARRICLASDLFAADAVALGELLACDAEMFACEGARVDFSDKSIMAKVVYNLDGPLAKVVGMGPGAVLGDSLYIRSLLAAYRPPGGYATWL